MQFLYINRLTFLSYCRTEKEIAKVQAASSADVDVAVKAARAAFQNPSWKKMPPPERSLLMYRLADLMEKKKELLATIDAWDNGMIPRPRSRGFQAAKPSSPCCCFTTMHCFPNSLIISARENLQRSAKWRSRRSRGRHSPLRRLG